MGINLLVYLKLSQDMYCNMKEMYMYLLNHVIAYLPVHLK